MMSYMQVREDQMMCAIKGVDKEIRDLRIYYDYVKNSKPDEGYVTKIGMDPRRAILDSIASHIKEKHSALSTMVSALPKNVVD